MLILVILRAGFIPLLMREQNIQIIIEKFNGLTCLFQKKVILQSHSVNLSTKTRVLFLKKTGIQK